MNERQTVRFYFVRTAVKAKDGLTDWRRLSPKEFLRLDEARRHLDEMNKRYPGPERVLDYHG